MSADSVEKTAVLRMKAWRMEGGMKKILTVFPVTEIQKKKLEDAVSGYEFVYKNSADVTAEDLRYTAILGGNVKPELLKHAGELEWVQLNSAGYDNYIKAGILKQDTLLTSATGAYGPAVSEHMLAMVFALQKRLHTYSQNMLSHQWKDAGSVTSIEGAEVLVVGLGDIGQSFAKKVKALGGRVTGIRRNISEKPDYVDEIYRLEALDSLLPKMDIVAVILPGSQENYHLFSEKQFKLMKKGSIFINAGRGSLVDEAGLLLGLDAGTPGSAGLDVTDPEPMQENNLLWDREEVLITPHTAGGFHMQRTLDLIAEIFTDNLKRFDTGKPLKNLVVH